MDKNKIIKIVSTLLVVVLLLFDHYEITKYKEGYDDYHRIMAYQFEDFGRELVKVEEKLGKFLQSEPSFINEKEYIDKTVNWYFMNANSDAGDQGNFYSNSKYLLMYSELNRVMGQITSDQILTVSEKNYIKGVYNFTRELIKSHKQVMGYTVGDESDFEKSRAFKKKVLKGYEAFSKSAQTLLEKPEYSRLVNYQGDFGSFDVKHAETVCKDLLAKVDKNQILKYDDRNEVNLNTITFKTFDDKGNVIDGILSDKTDYDVRYQKSTREVRLTTGFTTYPYSVNQDKNEETLNQMAQKVAKSINENAVLISQKKSYDKKGKRIRSIKYVFTQKINGIQDVSKNIEVIVEAQGLISQIMLTDTD